MDDEKRELTNANEFVLFSMRLFSMRLFSMRLFSMRVFSMRKVMKRCECMTRLGVRCKNNAIAETRFCRVHTPCYDLMMRRWIPKSLKKGKKVQVDYETRTNTYNYSVSKTFSASEFKELLGVLAYVKPRSTITFYDAKFPKNSIIPLSEVLVKTRNVMNISILDHGGNPQLKRLARKILVSEIQLQLLRIDLMYSTSKEFKDLLDAIPKNVGVRSLILSSIPPFAKKSDVIASLRKNVYLSNIYIPGVGAKIIDKIIKRNSSLRVLTSSK